MRDRPMNQSHEAYPLGLAAPRPGGAGLADPLERAAALLAVMVASGAASAVARAAGHGC